MTIEDNFLADIYRKGKSGGSVKGAQGSLSNFKKWNLVNSLTYPNDTSWDWTVTDSQRASTYLANAPRGNQHLK